MMKDSPTKADRLFPQMLQNHAQKYSSVEILRKNWKNTRKSFGNIGCLEKIG